MNHMEEVAKMLGVKMGEQFNIKYDDGTVSLDPYHIDNDGLKDISDLCDNSLARLLAGKYTVEKLPWKPKIGDDYYFINSDEDIIKDYWSGTIVDLALYYAGDCFATYVEAKSHAPEIINKIKTFYYNGEYGRNKQ